MHGGWSHGTTPVWSPVRRRDRGDAGDRARTGSAHAAIRCHVFVRWTQRPSRCPSESPTERPALTRSVEPGVRTLRHLVPTGFERGRRACAGDGRRYGYRRTRSRTLACWLFPDGSVAARIRPFWRVQTTPLLGSDLSGRTSPCHESALSRTAASTVLLTHGESFDGSLKVIEDWVLALSEESGWITYVSMERGLALHLCPRRNSSTSRSR